MILVLLVFWSLVGGIYAASLRSFGGQEVFVAPRNGAPSTRDRSEVAVEGTTIWIHDKVVILGDRVNNLSWKCTYTVGDNSTTLSGVVKSYLDPREPIWTMQASQAFDDFLYVDHDFAWILMNVVEGKTIGAVSPDDTRCNLKYQAAEEAALAFQLRLYQATGFIQSGSDPVNYLFTRDFTECRIADFGAVMRFEGWTRNEVEGYIIHFVARMFEAQSHCEPFQDLDRVGRDLCKGSHATCMGNGLVARSEGGEEISNWRVEMRLWSAGPTGRPSGNKVTDDFEFRLVRLHPCFHRFFADFCCCDLGVDTANYLVVMQMLEL